MIMILLYVIISCSCSSINHLIIRKAQRKSKVEAEDHAEKVIGQTNLLELGAIKRALKDANDHVALLEPLYGLGTQRAYQRNGPLIA